MSRVNDEFWIPHWQQVFSSLVPISSADQESRATPSDEHLERLEEQLQVRLPLSYRTFIKVFGPGRLMNTFDIFAPGYRGASVIDFLAGNKWQQVECEMRECPEQVKQLVAFGYVGYEYLAWDTRSVTSPGGDEYPIFQVPKQLDVPLVPLTDNFRAFIEYLCIDGKYWELMGVDYVPSWEDEEGDIRTEPCFELIGVGPTSSV